MTKCLHCDKSFEINYVEGNRDNPILFCSIEHRIDYRREILKIIVGLKDLDLMKLKEEVLDKGLLNGIVSDLQWFPEEDYGERLK